MVKETIIAKIRSFTDTLKKQNIKIDKVVLYGSQATGCSHEYSDIDVAIISPDFGKDRYEEGAYLFELASSIDPLIEPVPISTSSYQNDTWIPLIHEIRSHGIEVPLDTQ